MVLQPVGNKRMRAYSQGGGSDLVRRSCGCESLVLHHVGNKRVMSAYRGGRLRCGRAVGAYHWCCSLPGA